MPIYEFLCTNDENHGGRYARFEAIVAVDTETRACVCGAEASRDTRPLRFRHVGPVSSDMERFDEALLTPGERASGKRFTSGKQVQKWEEERGLTRQDPNGAVWRQAIEQQRDEGSDITRALAQDGRQGAVDLVKQMEIMDVTDWSRSDYVRWRDASDAISREVASGRIDPYASLADGVECGPSAPVG